MSLLCGLNNHVDVNTLIVSPSSIDINNQECAATAYAILRYSNDGVEYYNGNPCSTSIATSRGNWLDGGSAENVWVERVITSGTLDYADPGAGRLQLSTARTYGVSAGIFVEKTANVTFNFYDAAVDGNLLATVDIVFRAEGGIT